MAKPTPEEGSTGLDAWTTRSTAAHQHSTVLLCDPHAFRGRAEH
jgi:hypothetical protein